MARGVEKRTGQRGEEQPTRGQTRMGHGGKMTRDDRREMMEMHHRQTLWVYWTLVMLGVWMVLAPLTFDYAKGAVEPSGGRQVWLDMESRVLAMRVSDLVSGLLLVVLGWRALRPHRPLALWGCCAVGVWLNAAPLLFWCPSAIAYLNDTLVGVLVIALSILIPGMPAMMAYMKMGPETPPGWSYNPSSWAQRWIMIATGFAGWMVSRYLGAYQLGYTDLAWDPFFGPQSAQVLNSKMSHGWPVSDAALGSLAYTFEFLMGFMGGPARWRTMPWMVAFFGFLVIPLGLVHIMLVISQPVVVGAWCTLCLLAAAIMLPMIPLEGDEVVAMFQHMIEERRRGGSLWATFWKGGSPEGCTKDERTPGIEVMGRRPSDVLRASVWGMSVPWTLAVSTVIGIWLMAAPAVLGTEKPAADLVRLAGSLVVTVSVIAMGEVFRLGRILNVVPGLGLVVGPWLLGGAGGGGMVNAVICGLAIMALAVPRGPKTERYGLWDRFAG